MENEEFNFKKKPVRKSNTGTVLVLVGFILAIACLAAAAIALVRMGNELKEKGNGSQTAESSTPAKDRIVSDEVEQKLKSVKEVIDAYYLFDQEGADFDSALIKGYVSALGDPYTVYYTPEEYAALEESNSGEYCGIGVSVQQDMTTNVITVIRVFKGSPAEEAGLKAGDMFYKVNGEDITAEDIDLVVTKIRGEENTKVEITVFRPNVDGEITVECTRRIVQNETVVYEMKEDNVGYISVSSFEMVTADQFEKAYRDLEEKGMKGLVVDLRANPGGMLTAVTDMLDFLLPEGVLTYTLDKYNYREEITSDKEAALNVPMVLLVDGNSASASEVFTGAVRDFDVCTVVGTQTFGKGIVQVILPMDGGCGIKVTMARYYSPKGVCIHGEGFTPDVIVEYDSQYEGDNQLEKALEVIKEKMK